MPKCELCGVEASKGIYTDDHGLLVCKECKLKISNSPSRPCRSEFN